MTPAPLELSLRLHSAVPSVSTHDRPDPFDGPKSDAPLSIFVPVCRGDENMSASMTCNHSSTRSVPRESATIEVTPTRAAPGSMLLPVA